MFTSRNVFCLISDSTVLRHVVFILSCFRFFRGVHLTASSQYTLLICEFFSQNFLFLSTNPGQNKFATCQRAWTKIGCFKDKIKPSRPLPEMLLNDTDRYSKYHEKGYRLNRHKWTESIHRCDPEHALLLHT